MTIRDYRPEDYDAIVKNLKPEDMFDEIWDSRNNYETKVAENPSDILVAEVDGKVVGSVLIDQMGQEMAFIYRLVVTKSYRNQGVASQLLEKVYEVLKSRGTKEVALFANSKDEKLIEFYSHKGYSKGENTYRAMWKSLE